MARSHARIDAAIWRNPDFTRLSADAQRLYFLLLSQPNLSLVGVIDFMPARWAKLARDTNADEIADAVGDLETARFVLVDGDELLIRTFVVHDLTRLNVNVVKGVWSAWNAVGSAFLRSSIVHSLPDAVWAEERATPPAEAVGMRWSTPIERFVTTDRCDEPSGRAVPTSLDLPPSTLNRPPAPVPTDRPVDSEPRAWSFDRGAIAQARTAIKESRRTA